MVGIVEGHSCFPEIGVQATEQMCCSAQSGNPWLPSHLCCELGRTQASFSCTSPHSLGEATPKANWDALLYLLTPPVPMPWV